MSEEKLVQQKLRKIHPNETVEIKKQVAETSTKKPFKNFKRDEINPPNAISNVE